MSSEVKTKPTDNSVSDFIRTIEDPIKRNDTLELVKIYQKITKFEPAMWGPSIIGFDTYHYKYDSGREGDMCAAGFSPRKNDLTLYLVLGIDKYSKLLEKLGKYKVSKSCLYIKKLDDVDLSILEKIITEAYMDIKDYYSA